MVRKEPRRVKIVNLVVNPGLLSESVAVIAAKVYRPGEYPVRIRRNGSDPECFSIVRSYEGFASKLENQFKVVLVDADQVQDISMDFEDSTALPDFHCNTKLG